MDIKNIKKENAKILIRNMECNGIQCHNCPIDQDVCMSLDHKAISEREWFDKFEKLIKSSVRNFLTEDEIFLESI